MPSNVYQRKELSDAHDHVLIEQILFEGVSPPANGAIKPDLTRPGFGFEFKHPDAEKYKL